MGKQFRKHLTFQAGEISPRYFGRSDTPIYNAGLQVARNVFIDQRGGARSRGGLLHEAQIDANNARVFTLQASPNRFYTIIIYHLTMLLIAPGAKIGNDNLLLNGSFLNFGANWLTETSPASSSITFNAGECILRPDNAEIELIANNDFTLGSLAWTEYVSDNQSEVDFLEDHVVLQPRQQNNRYAGIAQAITTTKPNVQHTLELDVTFFNTDLRVQIGTGIGDGIFLNAVITDNTPLTFTPNSTNFTLTLVCEFPSETVIIDSVSIIEPTPSFARISQEATITSLPTDLHAVIVAQNTRSIINIDIGTTDGASDIATLVSSNQEIFFTFVPNNPTYFVSVRAEGGQTAEAKIVFVGTTDNALIDPNGIEMPAPWTEDQLDAIHSIESQEGNSLYFTHPNVPVQKLVYNRGADTFTALAPVVFTSTPIEWTGTNHPSTGTAFQGRLWLAGTPSEPQTIWGSVSGSAEDFDQTANTDASAIQITIQRFGTIEWLIGSKNLIAGTDSGENLITSQGGVLTQSDIQVEVQSTYGANGIQAIQVGEKIFYFTPDGRKLRAMAFNRDEQNWLSKDLTFHSEHITQGIAKRMTWGQHPNALFLVLLEDGHVASLTYDRTADTLGWTLFSLPGLDVKDIGSGLEDGISKFVVLGQRTPGKIDIEIQAPVSQLLDSYVEVFDAAGTNIITGLDHLEGETVRPIVDGTVDPLSIVVGGQITTQRSGIQLYAGIPYTATIKTLPPDNVTQIRSFKKRWNKVWAYLLASKQPIINGTRPPDRTPSTPMDLAEPVRTGHFTAVSLGWDDFGQITIEQDLPVSMYVLAIYGEMGAETL